MKVGIKVVSLIIVCIAVQLSCSSTKNSIEKDYETSIATHRQNTEQGLIIGDRAPLEESDLDELRYFPLDKSFEVIADVELAEGEKPFQLPTYSGITKTYIKYATTRFKIRGKSHTLNLYKNLQNIRMPQYKDLLFLPYKDVTNGDQTYGGGRYINLYTYDIVDDKITLDFNKSYNPWCAYSDGYNCPIPPIENHMEIAIMAGEINYAGERKQ